MKQLFASIVLFLALATNAVAGTSDEEHAALFQALGLDEIIHVMRQEGLSSATDIGNDLFPNRNGDGWINIVERIYGTDRMEAILRKHLQAELGETDIAPLIAFFTSDVGRQLIALEISGRRALLDTAVEDASKEALAIAAEDNTERYQLVKRFAEVNDLVEYNVVGALNSNYAFYIGLVDVGEFPASLTEDQILNDVWSQEPEIRENTTEWLYSYLLMAYQPLPDSYIQDYIDVSETEAGEALNRAIFTAFDVLFTDISKALGLAAASLMVGEDL